MALLSEDDMNNKNYRIFRVEEKKDCMVPKKITMIRIYAKDNDDAYKQLKDYIKVANKQYKYYVEHWTPYVVIRNGKNYTYDDLFDAWNAEVKDMPLLKRIYDNVSSWCWRQFIDKPRNILYCIRNAFYLLKNKQPYYASWCIDEMLIDTLLFNISILKNNKHTLSWKMLGKAILEKNKDLKSSDLEQYHQEHCQGYDKEIEDRAVELEQQMFNDLINDIKAYKYYMGDYEHIDKDDKEFVETDKKLHCTLPLVKGSYDNYDYKKLNSLSEKYWNRIWETVRIYGREFND